MVRILIVFLLFSPAWTAQDENQLDGQRWHEQLSAFSSPVLFSAQSLIGGEGLSYSFQNRIEGDLHKVLLSPMRLLGKGNKSIDFRLNFAQEEEISSLGIGVQIDISAIENPERRTYIHCGSSLGLFEDWGSPERDSNGDGFVDNRYSISTLDANLGVVKTDLTGSSYHLTGHIQKIRELSDENSLQATTVGYSASYSSRKRSNKLFFYHYGLSLEQLFTLENGDALSTAQIYSLAYGPFISFDHTYLRLRLSLPIVNQEGHEDERGFGPFFVLSFRL